MDGAAVILNLLAQDAGVTAMVPAEADPPRLTGDVLGQTVTLPAIRVMKISSTDRNILKPGARRRVTQRIQAEAHGRTMPEAKVLLKAIRKACADRLLPELGGLTEIAVHTDGEGPEGISADTNARVALQDFRVSYNEEC